MKKYCKNCCQFTYLLIFFFFYSLQHDAFHVVERPNFRSSQQVAMGPAGNVSLDGKPALVDGTLRANGGRHEWNDFSPLSPHGHAIRRVLRPPNAGSAARKNLGNGAPKWGRVRTAVIRLDFFSGFFQNFFWDFFQKCFWQVLNFLKILKQVYFLMYNFTTCREIYDFAIYFTSLFRFGYKIGNKT